MTIENSRATTMNALRARAEQFFAQHPSYRSLMLGVAQYWADEADDAVHCDLTASERAMPLWPHVCDQTAWDDEVENVPGEACWSCNNEIGWLDRWNDNGDAIPAFEAFCHEAGSQDEPHAHSYLPIAIARRAGDRIEVEMIGRLQRPETELLDVEQGERDTTWDDPRARELFELVCASPGEDGPRRVLADYLMERDNPRGEYIALSLERDPSAEVIAKRDALLAEHLYEWMHPLDRVMPAATAKFERGFLAAGEVCAAANDLDTIRGALAWGTVERLHVHDTSACVLDPAMKALREVGPILPSDLEALAGAAHAWSIEELAVTMHSEDTADLLVSATNLPRLQRLSVCSDHPDPVIAALPHASWWPRLERLTIVARDIAPATWRERRRELKVPWLAVAQLHDDPTFTAGWEIAMGPDDACEITLRGWTPHATFARLAELLAALRASSIALVRSAYYEPSAVDVERLRGATTIPITIARRPTT